MLSHFLVHRNQERHTSKYEPVKQHVKKCKTWWKLSGGGRNPLFISIFLLFHENFSTFQWADVDTYDLYRNVLIFKIVKPMTTVCLTGGKKCPKCGCLVFHENWKLTPELSEARWAHQEARRRELAEVVDFLQWYDKRDINQCLHFL